MIVAFGSFGISISFPTGPVIFTSAPGFKSPEMYVIHPFLDVSWGLLIHCYWFVTILSLIPYANDL